MPVTVSFGSNVPNPKHPSGPVETQLVVTPAPMTHILVPAGAGVSPMYAQPPNVWGSLGNSRHPAGLNGNMVAESPLFPQQSAIAVPQQRAITSRIAIPYVLIFLSFFTHLAFLAFDGFT